MTIERIIEWVIAFGAVVYVLSALVRAVSRGSLEGEWRKWTLFGTLVLVWLAHWFLKWLQVGIESSQSLDSVFWCSWCRKLDDVSFWTIIAGLIAGFIGTLVAVIDRVSLRDSLCWRAAWLAVSLLASATYLYAVGLHNPNNLGTFFWRGGSINTAHVVKLLQVAEGVTVVYFLFTVHFLHTLYLRAIWNDFDLKGPKSKGDWVRWMSVPGFYVLIYGFVQLVESRFTFFGELCRPCGFGNESYRNLPDIMVLCAAVWWPFLLPGIVFLVALVRRSIEFARAKSGA